MTLDDAALIEQVILDCQNLCRLPDVAARAGSGQPASAPDLEQIRIRQGPGYGRIL